MNQELSPDERIIVQVVASLPYLINEVPHPYQLKLFAELSGLGMLRVRKALRRLGLLKVLSELPDSAIATATSLLPEVMKPVEP